MPVMVKPNDYIVCNDWPGSTMLPIVTESLEEAERAYNYFTDATILRAGDGGYLHDSILIKRKRGKIRLGYDKTDQG